MADATMAHTRVCAKCGEAKPQTPEFFYRKLAGFQARCKVCRSAQIRAEYTLLPADVLLAEAKRKKDYRLANPEIVKERNRQNYVANREQIISQTRAYREKNIDRVLQRDRDYYQDNKTAKIASAIEYIKANPDKHKAYARKTYRKRAKDPVCRIRGSVSAHMWYSLKSNRGGQSWETLVGYSLEDLVRHMERQFLKGMTWDNYGRKGWHIDHIIPVSSFTFTSTSDPEFLACWALSNLRPLWERDNIVKRDQRLTLL